MMLHANNGSREWRSSWTPSGHMWNNEMVPHQKQTSGTTDGLEGPWGFPVWSLPKKMLKRLGGNNNLYNHEFSVRLPCCAAQTHTHRLHWHATGRGVSPTRKTKPCTQKKTWLSITLAKVETVSHHRLAWGFKTHQKLKHGQELGVVRDIMS